MVGTPDNRPTGASRIPEPEQTLTAAEAAHLAARKAGPVDLRARPPEPDRDRRGAVRVPSRRAEPRDPRHAPLALAAAVAATWAAVLTYVPVAAVVGLVQLVEGNGSLAAAVRLGVAGWLLGHGVPLHTADGPLGLVPLAIAGLAAWRVSRAGVHTTRAIRARDSGSAGRALAVAAGLGLAYGSLGLAAAAVLTGSVPAVPLVRSGLTLGLFGAVAGLSGALRATGALGPVAARLPAALRDGVRTGVVAALLMLASGALVTGVAIAVAGGDAADTIAAYRTGVAGQAGMTLLCLAYAPNAAVWAAAYLIGPGFAVGGDTAVRVSQVSVGALPAVPLTAGLPAGPLDGPTALVLSFPVLAGAAAGWLLVRRVRSAGPARGVAGPPATGRGPSLLLAAVVAGPVAGVLLGLAAMASGGPLGDGRLVDIGPIGWQVAVVSSSVLALGTLAGAGISWGLLGRRGR